MRVVRHADDDLWRGSWRYLGPKGYTLPVSFEYRGILPGCAAALACQIVLSLAGIGGWRFLISGGVFLGVMKLVGHFSSTERPVSSLAASFAHETSAPRPHQPQLVTTTLRPGRIPVHELPSQPRKGARR
jgi:hypothetical protein